MAAWDRAERDGKQEPPRAYQHFTVYRDQGPERTLEKTGKIQGVTLATLEELSAKWNWVARCDQWDSHVQSCADRAFLTEAAKRGRLRAHAYSALLGKALECIKHVDASKASLAHIAAAMKVAAEGMRLEEGLATQLVEMEVTDARLILSRLPAEVRAGLCRVLEDGADAGADPRSYAGVSGGAEE